MSSNQIASDIKPMTRLEGQARRKTSIAIGLVLTFLVVAFYAVTLVRLQGNMEKRAELKASVGTSSGLDAAASTVKPNKSK